MGAENKKFVAVHYIGPENKVMIENWKSAHGKYMRLSGWGLPARWQRRSDSLSKPYFVRTVSMEEVFAHILTFKAVVEAIDHGIDAEIRAGAQRAPETTCFKNSGGNPVCKKNVHKTRVGRLIDEWERLHDIGFSQSEREKLGIELNELLRLQYAQYWAFIQRMIENSVIYYEVEIEEPEGSEKI